MLVRNQTKLMEPLNVRVPSAGISPRLSEETRRSNQLEATPDLRRHCPICGNAYQWGEEVVSLASRSFGADAAPSLPAIGSDAVLGHPGCVLPRLLTLLASFQPAPRFDQ